MLQALAVDDLKFRYRHSPQRYILDWALVALKPHITTLEVRDNLNVVRATYVYTRYTSANKSQLPQKPQVSPDFCISRFKADYLDPPPNKLQKELADILDLPPMVFKCGRTTAWTAGRANEIDAVKYGKWREGRALCILGAGNDKPFSMKGDSGSIVFTDEGRPVAMVFGGRSPGFRDVSFATPIDVIMEDIREKLDLEKVTAR